MAQKISWRVLAVILWTTTTLALSAWWMILAIRLVNGVQDQRALSPDFLMRQQRMLLMEGSFLFFLLLLGGFSLLYYILRESRRAEQIQIFFSSFTHDVKTSLASLRLQAESLEEDLREASQAKLLKRLVKDTVRLQLQLENSLFIANPNSVALHMETLSLNSMLQTLSHQFPDLQISTDGYDLVRADHRALESVLKNLIQNSLVHGDATCLKVFSQVEGSSVRVRLQDNGVGFKGNQKQAARPFHKHHGASGTGLGLFLVKTLVEKMNGRVEFDFSVSGGFATDLILQKGSRS